MQSGTQQSYCRGIFAACLLDWLGNPFPPTDPKRHCGSYSIRTQLPARFGNGQLDSRPPRLFVYPPRPRLHLSQRTLVTGSAGPHDRIHDFNSFFAPHLRLRSELAPVICSLRWHGAWCCRSCLCSWCEWRKQLAWSKVRPAVGRFVPVPWHSSIARPVPTAEIRFFLPCGLLGFESTVIAQSRIQGSFHSSSSRSLNTSRLGQETLTNGSDVKYIFRSPALPSLILAQASICPTLSLGFIPQSTCRTWPQKRSLLATPICYTSLSWSSDKPHRKAGTCSNLMSRGFRSVPCHERFCHLINTKKDKHVFQLHVTCCSSVRATYMSIARCEAPNPWSCSLYSLAYFGLQENVWRKQQFGFEQQENCAVLHEVLDGSRALRAGRVLEGVYCSFKWNSSIPCGRNFSPEDRQSTPQRPVIFVFKT